MRDAVPVSLTAHLRNVTVTRQVSALNPALRIPPAVVNKRKKTLIDNTIHMKKMTFTLGLLLSVLTVIGQDNDTIAKSNRYSNLDYGYRVSIPIWFKVINTGHEFLWGGTMEPVNGIENAIMISGIVKKDYKNLKALINDKVSKYKMGDKINENQTFMLRNELGILENIGPGYKVQMLTKNVPYHCAFVFAETSVGYLWIVFTATPETYNINYVKFKEFLKGLEILKK